MRRYRRRGVTVLIGIVMICAAAVSLNSIVSIARIQPVMAELTRQPVIIIDPGHGGIDGGAVGVNGVIEKDINLAICLIMRDIFVANGFDVVMTRDTDISIHDEGVKSIRKQKTSDLHNRLAIVNNYPDAVFLSVHQNIYSGKSSKGAQIFFSPNDPESGRLASLLQEDFINALQPDNTRKYKKAGKNLYLMYKAKCPAVLVECGFLSNPEEAEMLADTEYQAKIAFTAFCSVMRFLRLDESVAGEFSE